MNSFVHRKFRAENLVYKPYCVALYAVHPDPQDAFAPDLGSASNCCEICRGPRAADGSLIAPCTFRNDTTDHVV